MSARIYLDDPYENLEENEMLFKNHNKCNVPCKKSLCLQYIISSDPHNGRRGREYYAYSK